ncbi:alanine racemase [Anaeromicropila populeti]|uniref:Alanine racemase n=1 Tax=Anaeromicropila populeti TaxID=37658 RepID=A0A1I6J8F1_9FIRM|nr:alanine racemase [Anaeromicropila populeti]SFR75275.1 alanine racemase [Anaeromicropila populeti]
MKEYYRVHAAISLDAVVNNILETKKILKPDTKIMAVIKADGYGHGAIPIAEVLNDIVDAYGLALLEEAIEIRKMGITKPLLILGFTPEPQYKDMVKYDVMTTVFKYDMAEQIAKEAMKQNKIAKIHLAVDTGMSRIGFKTNEESIDIISRISKLEGIEINGCFTHFAKADEMDKSFSYEQLRRFNEFIIALEKKGIFIPIKHIANSAAIMEIPEANLDMVRSGISTYGLYPSDEVNRERLFLMPAMEIKSHISFLKELEEGIGVSYGLTAVTSRRTKVATIPVGYADGYSRSLSNKGRVLIRGRSAPILGRICMDQFMVDVTDVPGVQEGDVVTLVGRDGDEYIAVEEIADKSYSFNYETICAIGKRIPRVYYYQGKKVGTLDYYCCSESTYELNL